MSFKFEFKADYDGKFIYPNDDFSDYMSKPIGLKIFVDKTYEDENRVYGSINDIPITMKKISDSWNIRPSTNSLWGKENNKQILWEWYPNLNYVYISSLFWESIGEKEENISDYQFSIDGIIENKYFMKLEYITNNLKKNYDRTGVVTDWLPLQNPWRIIETVLDNRSIEDDKFEIYKNVKYIIRLAKEKRLKDIIETCDTVLSLDIFSERDISISDIEMKEASDFNSIRNILIVDDMSLNRRILKKRLLTIDKFDLSKLIVTEAKNGKDAIEIFQRHNGYFDLILMDCLMPELDGYETTTEIHNLCSKTGTKKIPVIAITATMNKDTTRKCKECGIKYIIRKPYCADEIIKAIKLCCNYK